MPNTSYDLSSADVAARLKVTEQTVRRWADTGKLRHIVLPSGTRRFSEADVVAILTPIVPVTGAAS